jgi:hypothetical protein
MSENGNHLKRWTSETAPRHKAGGRTHGARNRFALSFIEAIREEFEIGGQAALRILRIEKPEAYLRLCALIIPHELNLVASAPIKVTWLDDDDEESATIDAVPQNYNIDKPVPPAVEKPVVASEDSETDSPLDFPILAPV